MRHNTLGYIVGFFCLVLLSSSCTNYKKIPYLVGVPDTTIKIPNHPQKPIIHTGDQLSIFISSSDPIDAFIFNQPNFSQVLPQATSVPSTSSTIFGYVVNEDGNLLFPKLGIMKVAGMTKEQLEDTLQKKLLPFLKDPQVSVRLVNFRINVLGEVTRPGLYVIPNEQVTFLEALSMAGDLSINGRRDSILIIRRTDSVTITHHINLQDKELLQSPYYNLEPGDVIYVMPNRVKANTSDEVLQILPIVLSAVSTLILFLSYLLPKL